MNIKLVKTKSADSKFLYDLRNSSEIRFVSINRKKISLNEHSKWFSSLEKNKNSYSYVINYNSRKIGYIRTFRSNKNNLISIALIKKYRNKKIGRKSLLIFETKTKLKKSYSICA